MIKLAKYISNFCVDLLLTIYFFLRYFLRGFFLPKLRLKKRNGKTLILFGNAASLSEVLNRLDTDDEFKVADFVALNFFATNTDHFFKIKPTHYCFADPMFYKKNHNYFKVKSLFELLNEKVDWDMNIYIISEYHKKFLEFSNFGNPFLHIIPVVGKSFMGFSFLKHWAYRNNLAVPPFANVSIFGIYIGINQGYDTIKIYGVDHSVFSGLCVDENNQVCTKLNYFYNRELCMQPILRNDNDKVYRMSEFILMMGMTFKAHDIIAEYANSLGVNIVNCSRESLVDSYPRYTSNTTRFVSN